MSKMSDLNLALDEMITVGQNMIKATNALKEIFSSEDTETHKPACKPLFDAKPAKEEEEKKYSFQEVRGIMASLAGKGKKAEAMALLTEFGASRLSEVKEDDYSALVAKAEEIANE